MIDVIRDILVYILLFFEFAIFIRIIWSWFGWSTRSGLYQFLVQLTEPLLGSIRRILPRTGMFDLSPLIALLLLSMLEKAISRGVFF